MWGGVTVPSLAPALLGPAGCGQGLGWDPAQAALAVLASRAVTARPEALRAITGGCHPLLSSASCSRGCSDPTRSISGRKNSKKPGISGDGTWLQRSYPSLTSSNQTPEGAGDPQVHISGRCITPRLSPCEGFPVSCVSLWEQWGEEASPEPRNPKAVPDPGG